MEKAGFEAASDCLLFNLAVLTTAAYSLPKVLGLLTLFFIEADFGLGSKCVHQKFARFDLVFVSALANPEICLGHAR